MHPGRIWLGSFLAMKERLKTESLQQQLYNTLTNAILCGELPPGKAIPSIAELANIYQVSRTTVRVVLERMKNEKLIKPRRSRPALAALPARSRKNLRIGVICYSSTHRLKDDKFEYKTGPWGWLLYRSILLSAKEHRITCTFAEDFDAEALQNVDGIIGIGGDEAFYEKLLSTGKIFVNLMSGCNSSKPGALYLDRREAMTWSALYFLSNGVKSFYSVGDRTLDALTMQRKENFDHTLLENGVPPEQIKEVRTANIDVASGHDAAAMIWAEKPVMPIGLLARGDFIAKGIVHYFMEHDLVPKKDFFVIGQTDLEESAKWPVPLTVQSCPYEALGAAALELLKRSIDNKTLNDPVLLKSRLIIRKS